jgi:hypothetical protein
MCLEYYFDYFENQSIECKNEKDIIIKEATIINNRKH